MAKQRHDPAIITDLAARLTAGAEIPLDEIAQAARAVTGLMAQRYPGATIEVRVPPVAAVQVGAIDGGSSHRRGTPPNVVELAPLTMIELAAGLKTWDEAVEAGLIRYSGAHARDVAAMLPLI